MSRLTITLDDSLHLSLKEAAAQQGRTMGSIIEESLRLLETLTNARADELLNGTRLYPELSEYEAMEIALKEIRNSLKQ